MTGKITREWPLAIVLASQAALSVPWLWRTAPFTDEALYLHAGHQLWSNWLHHVAMPSYAASFSGALVIYPPIGAAADSLGGLPAARALSLIFMMGATAAVYFTGLRLFGRVAAFYAAALFAVTGLIVHYGSFATYNPLALLFLAISTWAATYIRNRGPLWLVASILALAMSNATKYATLAWDPIIVSFVLLHNWADGVTAAVRKCASLIMGVIAVETVLLWTAGPAYVQGLVSTTLVRTLRNGAYVSPTEVMWRAFALTGVVLVGGTLAVALSLWLKESWQLIATLVLFVLGGMLAPINQSRIHELTSLDKNMGFGIIFPVLGVGYAVATGMRLAEGRLRPLRAWAAVGGAMLILTALFLGRIQNVQFRGLNSHVAHQIVSAMRHNYRGGTYIIVAGNIRVDQYYMPSVRAAAWMGVFTPNPAARKRFKQRICSGLVSLVVMRIKNGTYDHSYDQQLYRMLADTHHYKLALRAGEGAYITQVWSLETRPRTNMCSVEFERAQ